MTLPILDSIPSNRAIRRTDIEWSDYAVGSPFIFKHKVTGQVIPNACVKVSSGCANCYAEQIGLRFKKGLAYTPQEMANLEVHLDQGVIDSILRFRPSPVKGRGGEATYKNGRSRPAVFLGDMTDIFGEWVPFDLLDCVYAAMALRPDVDFLLLTKRPERMAEYLDAFRDPVRKIADAAYDVGPGNASERADRAEAIKWQWPLPNVWHGCSAENQKTLDERVPHLLRCPSAVRFLSLEPLLEPIDLDDVNPPDDVSHHFSCLECDVDEADDGAFGGHCIDWVIVGGESGRGARPYNLAWPRSIIEQCAAVGVPCFHKQVGSRPVTHSFAEYLEVWERCGHGHMTNGYELETAMESGSAAHIPHRDSKGGELSEWPHDLRVRQMPGVKHG